MTIRIAVLLGVSLALAQSGAYAAAGDGAREVIAALSSDAKPFDPARGEALWRRENDHAGQARRCAMCHGAPPVKTGKHARTGKPIKPMAPSINPKSLSSARKVRKWLKRNCKWTLGRECTATEKGDVLTYLLTL